MYPLKYLTLILYALSAARCFSFGVYGLRRGRGGGFAAALALIAAGGALLAIYLMSGD